MCGCSGGWAGGINKNSAIRIELRLVDSIAARAHLRTEG